uniref:Uncharacterized protein n=1 Tax=Arundo donax TaxID=35708 RepID=A0A0A9AUE0_ARUDO
MWDVHAAAWSDPQGAGDENSLILKNVTITLNIWLYALIRIFDKVLILIICISNL